MDLLINKIYQMISAYTHISFLPYPLHTYSHLTYLYLDTTLSTILINSYIQSNVLLYYYSWSQFQCTLNNWTQQYVKFRDQIWPNTRATIRRAYYCQIDQYPTIHRKQSMLVWVRVLRKNIANVPAVKKQDHGKYSWGAILSVQMHHGLWNKNVHV